MMFANAVAATREPEPGQFRVPRGIFGKPRRDVLNQVRPSEADAAAAGPSRGFAEAFQPFAMPGAAPGAVNAEGGLPQLQSAIQATKQQMTRPNMGPGDPPMRPGGPLGASLRQPFDYDAALKVLAGRQDKPKTWQYIVAALGDAATTLSDNGGQPYAMRSLLDQRNEQQQRLQDAVAKLTEWRYRDYARQNEADLGAAAPFTIGRDRIAYDPATGQAQTIYDGPEDFELYAEKLGLEPGSDEYFRAVEDYVLRSSGPSAYDRDLGLDDHRTANDERLEGVRHGNRVDMERLRQGNRRGMVDYRNANPPPSRSTRQTLPVVRTPAEARKLPKGTRFRTPDGRVKVA